MSDALKERHEAIAELRVSEIRPANSAWIRLVDGAPVLVEIAEDVTVTYSITVNVGD